MIRTKKLLSAILAAVMVVSMLSGLQLATAVSPEQSAQKSASEVDRLCFSAFKAVTTNPGYGSPAPSGITFVSADWVTVLFGSRVYMNFDGEIYKAVKGMNAFSSIDEALAAAGSNDLIIKVGAGTYTSTEIVYNYSGLKIYGNYAGVNPNVAGSDIYTMDLNPIRDPAMESLISESQWNWTIKGQNVTIDGFKFTGAKTYVYPAVSGQLVEGFYFYNNIVESVSNSYFINCNRGSNSGVFIKYNRFSAFSGTLAYLGGAMFDVEMDYNYFENGTGLIKNYSSCGQNEYESLISFSNNVVKNCTQGCNFDYNNSNFGANLDYKRLVGNIISGSGATQGSFFKALYRLEYYKAVTDTAPTACTDTRCKTTISDNLFYNIPVGVRPVNLIGDGYLSGKACNFVISITKNKFVFAASAGVAVSTTAKGTVDISNNFYGVVSGTSVVRAPFSTSLFVAGDDSKIITMPFYLDYDLTNLSGGIQFSFSARLLRRNGIDDSNFIIDNDNMVVKASMLDNRESVDFDKVITAAGVTYKVYSDFLLSHEITDYTIDILDTITHAYIIATETETGQAVKYDLLISSDTDKTKADIRALVDASTNDEFADTYTINGLDVDVPLAEKYIYFPFTLLVSPSATYSLYTDAACTVPYTDTAFYMQPDTENHLYAKVVSGDGSKTNIYNFKFTRTGTPEYDARILSAITPEDGIQVFNNERKAVVYRPYAMAYKTSFDFNLTPNSSYEIYKNYDETTGTFSNLLSKQGDVKEIDIPDAISYFYVKVTSSFGFYQVYNLIAYNDVRSDDNVITGISGITTGISIVNNVITLDISDTLAAANARFETNSFATVDVYSDANKLYKLTPSISNEEINNRIVEVRTFQLGITSQVSYFYVDVTSETGRLNSYKVILKKGGTSVPFTDVSTHWAKDYVNEVARLGIMNGYYNKDSDIYTFLPGNFASRQEMAALLCRMMGIDPLSFKNEILSGVYEDSDDIAEWAYNYTKAAYFLKIMVGSKNAEDKLVFKPTDKITRQEFFQAVCNILKLDTAAAADYDLSRFSDAGSISGWAIPATKAIVKAGVVEGSDGKINPKANITRAEISKILAQVNNISADVPK